MGGAPSEPRADAVDTPRVVSHVRPELQPVTTIGDEMAKSVTDLAREVIERMDRGESIDDALSLTLATSEVDEGARQELEAQGLRDAVVHEAFHELLDWHAGFGGLPEFQEIDDAIHRMAERVGHDLDQQPQDRAGEGGRRLLH
jgi:hypothetical protein